MKTLFIFFTLFVFVISVSAQSEVEDFLKSSRSFEYLKKYDEAISRLNKALELQPDNPDLYLRRAHLYAFLDKKEEVLSDVTTAISFRPDDFIFLESCVKELNAGKNYEESLQIAERLISKAEKRTFSLGYRIRYKTNFLLKNYRKTIEDIIISRDLFEAYYENVKLYINENNTETFTDGLLVETLDNLKDDPGIFSYYDQLFKIADKRKNGPHTIASLMALHSLNISLYAGYAAAYERNHSPDESFKLFDKYAGDLGLETRAEIFQKMKKFDFALKDLTEIIKHAPSKSTHLTRRGDLFMLMNEPEKANADYEEARKLDANPGSNDDFYARKIAAVKRLINMRAVGN